MKKKAIWIAPVAVLALLFGAFFIYVGDCYRADDVAKAALKSDAQVIVTSTDYGWHFDGPSEDRALVFYPGAKVEAAAYAPLMRLLAERGMDACLVKAPFNISLFDEGRAAAVMQEHDYAHWYVGGHSLGGLSAANFAATHGDRVEGVILCAAYSVKPLEALPMEIVVYGSEDRVLNRERLEKNADYAPENYEVHIIEGGNHAQFGSYGAQKRDGTASISPQAQWSETVDAILEALSIEVNKR